MMPNDAPVADAAPKLAELARRVLPSAAYQLLRRVFMAVFTPSMYAAQHGYFRSARQRRVVDASGAAAPWMTFPTVEFLESRSFVGRSVLEFGSGTSSVWWGARADRVLTLETDSAWTRLVRQGAPVNVEVIEVPLTYASSQEFAEHLRTVTNGERFDVVVIDGGDRVNAILAAPSAVTPDGIIIIDDLDLFRHEPVWAAALDNLRAAGFGCVDFYGLAVAAPASRTKRCTSMFLRGDSFITAWAAP